VNSMNLVENTGNGISLGSPGTTQVHKIPRLPMPSETGYLMEINDLRGAAKENEYDAWDVWKDSKATFGADRMTNGKGNLGTRMMHYTNQNHLGKMNVSFLDGHSEARRLTHTGVPFTLFFPNF
ncbi:MAG: hypothetical protein NE330_06465, partial [Lentisphaeraceae bacterium]|nr:hypothetical protein [Lentisphaeraceae bacterium]